MNKRLAALVSAVLVLAMASGAVLAQARGRKRPAVAPPPAMPAPADMVLRLPKVIGDNMVLQREMPLPIWGWAAPEQKIKVALAGASAEAVAGADGRWTVKLPAMAAGGPHEMTVSAEAAGKAAAASIVVKNILVGEVWLCSGQSNMEMALAGSQGGAQEVSQAEWPNIRLFQPPHFAPNAPSADVSAEWRPCSPLSVPNFSGVAYFFGRELHKELKVPIGLINSSWGGSAIQPWTPAEGYDIVEAAGGTLKKEASGGMYNGMIVPLAPFAIRGALWYQGETNVREAAIYDKRMQALILGWRKVWGQGEFPFYFVQLAPYAGYRQATVLPAFWETQTRCMAIPRTGMVVVSDLVHNIGDIHPRNKLDVGKRLAAWALAKDYGRKDMVYCGPMYKSFSVDGDKAFVSFDHVGGGLASRDGKDLTYFQVAGEDRKFVPAKARVVGDKIEVGAEGVKPVAVRFAYEGTAQPNLMNKEGFQANSFRTDNW